MSSVIDILTDETNDNFEATTCALARLKFQRLLKKHNSSIEYGDVLLRSAKHLANEEEYDKFLCWLSNPKSVKGDRNPHPSCTGEVIPEGAEIFKKTNHAVIVCEEQIKNIPNAKFIHIKNPKYYETKSLDSDDEKIAS